MLLDIDQDDVEPNVVPSVDASDDRIRSYIAGSGIPARLLHRTLQRAGSTVEVGRCAAPSEVSGSGYPDAFFVTEGPDDESVGCIRAWSRMDGVAIIAFQATEVADRLRLLDAGADDVWPVEITPEEAGARLRALRRRIGRDPRLDLSDGHQHLSITRNDLMVEQRPIRMTRIRHHLLYVLAENHPRTTGHDELIEKVWDYPVIGDGPGFVQTQVSRLRRELDDAGLPDLIRTARGIGYGICPQFARPELHA